VPDSLEYGTPSLLIGYGLTVIGLLVGLRLAHAPLRQMFWVPVLALPVMIVLAILMSLMPSLGQHPAGSLARVANDVFGLAFVVVGSALAGLAYGRVESTVRHQRGTRVIDSRTIQPRSSGPGEITFAGYPVLVTDETKHFKLIGTTGTGKSTVIRELMTGALTRGDRAIIADPNGSYLKQFRGNGGAQRILNPFDSNAAQWDLFTEITEPHDADQLARSLIPDSDGTDRSWRLYARTFLTSVLRQLHRTNVRDVAKLYYVLVMAPAEELRDLLEATPAAPFLGQDNGKFFESVRAVANVHLAGLEHIARQTRGEALSVRKWIREGKGILYLPYRASEIASLRSLISTWMRLAIFEAMNGEEGDQRLWFVVDELDALGAIDGLNDALARLRKFGGRCILGFQSIAQVRGTYGDADAQTIVENCGNSLILRCSASERGGTSEFASRLIGKREVIRQQTSLSRPSAWDGAARQTRTVSEQQVVEDAVMASEIEQLPDLSGFLKVASRPEWRRVSISRP
jgi:type IV secretory pathway TraG/TraD family ATPase VirD4